MNSAACGTYVALITTTKPPPGILMVPSPTLLRPREISMDQRLSAIASILAPAAGTWTSLVNLLRTQIAIDVRTYRPEKYYMRGPGPKWREKHAGGHDRVLS